MLLLEDLRKHFGQTRAVDGVSGECQRQVRSHVSLGAAICGVPGGRGLRHQTAARERRGPGRCIRDRRTREAGGSDGREEAPLR
jgi:hypothetical protein